MLDRRLFRLVSLSSQLDWIGDRVPVGIGHSLARSLVLTLLDKVVIPCRSCNVDLSPAVLHPTSSSINGLIGHLATIIGILLLAGHWHILLLLMIEVRTTG